MVHINTPGFGRSQLERRREGLLSSYSLRNTWLYDGFCREYPSFSWSHATSKPLNRSEQSGKAPQNRRFWETFHLWLPDSLDIFEPLRKFHDNWCIRRMRCQCFRLLELFENGKSDLRFQLSSKSSLISEKHFNVAEPVLRIGALLKRSNDTVFLNVELSIFGQMFWTSIWLRKPCGESAWLEVHTSDALDVYLESLRHDEESERDNSCSTFNP